MASNWYRVRTGATATVNGRRLIDDLTQLGDAFARCQQDWAALTQERDGTTGTSADYVTPAAAFGFVDAADILDPTVAQAAYAELGSLIATCEAALEQGVARFRQ